MKQILYILTISALLVGCSKKESPIELVESRFAAARYEQAIIAGNAVLQESTDDAELLRSRHIKGQSYMALAVASRERNQQREAERLVRLAIGEFSKALELNEDDFDAYYRRSDAYKLLGNESACMKDAQSARERDPSYKIAYTNELRRKQIDLRDIDRTIDTVAGIDDTLVAHDEKRRDTRDLESDEDELSDDEERLSSVRRPSAEDEDGEDGEHQNGSLTNRLTNQKLANINEPLATSNQSLKNGNKPTVGQEKPKSKSDDDNDDTDEPKSMEEERPRHIVSQPSIPRTTWNPQVSLPAPQQPAVRPQPTTGFVNNANRAHNPFPNYPTTGYTAPRPRTDRQTATTTNHTSATTGFGLGKVVTQNLPGGSMQFTGAMPFEHRAALGGTSDKQAYLTPAQPLNSNLVPSYTPPPPVKPLEPSNLWKRPQVYFSQ